MRQIASSAHGGVSFLATSPHHFARHRLAHMKIFTERFRAISRRRNIANTNVTSRKTCIRIKYPSTNFYKKPPILITIFRGMRETLMMKRKYYTPAAAVKFSRLI